ncbi:hypothetical protein DESUT3_10950 [Desulfuromonas versatilis]|uniref:Uncharacterized protein n=1 Tax=Desulfuromonas versatilis TaxID=2802975 RepID=A0ABM8HQF9_9BACT|nr:hypothetical protein [Desulfuromonas versatilis]BCR04026.1 hypothetical protein DESUT3_10950 [Desulfuromonas versatilis]
MIVTEDNIRDVVVSLPSEQAAELRPGCETWPVEAHGPASGQITVYPESGYAAVSWGRGSFWGHWRSEDRVIVLEELVDNQQLVVDEVGHLWVALDTQEFLDRAMEQFIRPWDLSALSAIVEGGDLEPLKIKVGCSRVPIFRGRELAAGLLEAMQAPDGPFARFRRPAN